MSALSRRSFFRSGLALPAAGMALAANPIAAGAQMLAAAPTAAAAMPSSVAEDPRLLSIGARIGPALDAYNQALDAKAAARAVADSMWPKAPAEIVVTREHILWRSGVSEDETDPEGKRVRTSENGFPPMIVQARLVRDAIAGNRIYGNRRSKFGRRVHQIIKHAETYEAACAVAIEASGIGPACDEVRYAAYDVEKIAYEARALVPRTLQGVIIMARALVAHSEAELDAHGFMGRSGAVLGRELATALLAVS